MGLSQIEVETMAALKAAAREYTKKSEKIDWEERRYEIAKAVVGQMKHTTPDDMADAAVQVADALISRLRKTL